MRRTYKRGNAGALCSMGAASSDLTWEIDSAGAFAGARYVERLVLIECSRAGRRSMAMIRARVVKLRREP